MATNRSTSRFMIVVAYAASIGLAAREWLERFKIASRYPTLPLPSGSGPPCQREGVQTLPLEWGSAVAAACHERTFSFSHTIRKDC